jgi:hypothetical protein
MIVPHPILATEVVGPAVFDDGGFGLLILPVVALLSVSVSFTATPITGMVQGTEGLVSRNCTYIFASLQLPHRPHNLPTRRNRPEAFIVFVHLFENSNSIYSTWFDILEVVVAVHDM